MAKRTFTTQPKKAKPAARGGSRRQTRSSRPVVVAPPPSNDSTKLAVIGSVVGVALLVLVIALASGNRGPQPVAAPQPVTTISGQSVHERMMNQRYGGEMEGKTVQEWMEENGDTEFAKQRREARQKR